MSSRNFNDPYNIDWIFSSNSNVHVANDRSWYTRYTPFTSRVHGVLSGAEAEVVGIGDVRLEVRTDHSTGLEDNCHTLSLHDVLHVPTGVANLVGRPVVEQLSSCISGRELFMTTQTGATLLIDGSRLDKLLLKGQTYGQSSLDPNAAHILTVTWPHVERARWELCKRRESADYTGSSNGGHKRTHSTIQSEVGSTAYGNGEASNASGNRRKRRNRRGGKGKHAVVREGDGEENQMQDLTEPASHPHQNLPRYSAAEKAWLKTNYGNEFKFLRAYGLRIDRRGHRKQGEQIVRTMMDREVSVPPVSGANTNEQASRSVTPSSDDSVSSQDPWKFMSDMDPEDSDRIFSAIVYGTRPY